MLVTLLLSGCRAAQATPTPDRVATGVAEAKAVAATLTAEAPMTTPTAIVTDTPALTAMPMPIQPTSTSTPPTATPTLPALSTGSLQGKLVEAPLIGDSGAVERPSLANALVVLCLKTSENECTVYAELSTRSDTQQEFTFDSLMPGEYVVLYNPFRMTNESAYWMHWDERTLDFADANSLLDSFAPGAKSGFFASGPGGGIVTKDIGGNLTITTVHANTAIWIDIHPLIVEFVGENELLTVNVTAGQTSQLTIQSHAEIHE